MSIDLNSVRRLLKLAREITSEKVAMYLDDDCLANEIAGGETVLTLGWDSDEWGSSGSIWVTRWHEMYFTRSSDYDPEGPFATLNEVLKQDRIRQPCPNPTLDSRLIETPMLLQIGIHLTSEDHPVVVINGIRYRHSGLVLVEAPEDE